MRLQLSCSPKPATGESHATIQHFAPCEAWYVSAAHAPLGIGSPDQCPDRARRRHRPSEERVPMAEAIRRIKADIAGKGIKFFMEID
jgi:hypothetical protein